MSDDDKSRPNDGDETVFDGSVAPMALGASPTFAAEDDGKKRRFKLPGIKPGLAVFVVLAFIIAFAFVPMAASSLKKTPKDKVGISYGGGPFEAAHFQRIVDPGSSLFFNGWFDPLYLYPADQQNYIVSSAASVKDGSTTGSSSTVNGQPIVAPSKDRVQVTYQAAIYYKLNIDNLQSFHEEFGLKYSAYTASGWKNLIQDTLRQQIENALLEETRRYDVGDIYGNVDVLLDIQGAVQDTLTDRLQLAMGGEYFCAPTYTRGGECGTPTFIVKSVDIPQSIVTSYEGNRSSAVDIVTRQNELEQRKIEAQGVRELNAAFGDNGDVYALLRAIESGNISFWVIPDSTGLNLGTGSGAAPAARWRSASSTGWWRRTSSCRRRSTWRTGSPPTRR